MNINTIIVSEEERVSQLAPQIEALMMFAANLIPDLDLLERTYKNAQDKESWCHSAAPIIGALGRDYEEEAASAKLHTRRAEAIVNLVKVLYETEHDRAEMKKRKQNKEDVFNSFFRR